MRWKNMRFHFEYYVNERVILRPMYDEMERNIKYLGTVYSELYPLYLTCVGTMTVLFSPKSYNPLQR
jgi:hypothetical protein